VKDTLAIETELKLAVTPPQMHALIRQNWMKQFAVAAPATHHMTARYFDTRDDALHKYGVALRVRQEGSTWIQTLKMEGGPGGALARHEWEATLPGPAPDLGSARHEGDVPARLASLLRDIDRGNALQEKFVVQVKRMTWQLRFGDAQVEMAGDEGTIASAESTAPISEIELELKSGGMAALYALATELAAHVPVQVTDRSKAERGYALCLGLAEGPRKAGAIALTQDLSIDAGIHAILASCLHHAQANARGVIDTDDPEYLHQMRVGLRRFRCAIKLFGPWTILPASVQDELAWLSTVLGNARDNDVFVHATLPAMMADVPAESTLSQLAERASAVAGERRILVRKALQSKRYGQVMLSLFGWADCMGWHEGADEARLASLRKPLSGFARKAVARGHAKIEKRGQALHRNDTAALHRLRIACKQNRYAVEFFRELASDKRAGAYIKALTSLQDTLGLRNDVAVAMTLLHDLEQAAPELTPATSFARGYLNCRATAGLRDVRKTWRHFSTLSPSKLFR
jgi:inorganic triphosphatase YgiF